MNVLLAAKHPLGGRMPIGGVQSWCATVSAELVRRGHVVTCWGPEWALPEQRFEVGIFANLQHTAQSAPLCDRVLKLSHGIVPDEAGGPGFAATSEEVAARWMCDRGVYRQPMDLAFWSPGTQDRTLLVRHSYRGGLGFLPQLADGLEFVHLRDRPREAVRDALQRAVTVVASGRAAVEAMACGAPVVIADDRGYQGPLMDPDPLDAMHRNYSGRGGQAPTEKNMAKALESAIMRGSLLAHVQAHHDVGSVVDRIMEALC